jgi:hypothetical protein
MVTHSGILQDLRKQEIPLLHTLLLLTVDQSLGPAEPVGRPRHFTSQGKINDQPKRATHSEKNFVDLDIEMVSTFEGIKHVIVTAQHVDTYRYLLKV